MTTQNNTDSKQEVLLPLTTYKNKRIASDGERFRLNAELNTYFFNNCDHEHDGYPNHLACRPCVLDCLAAIASRASVAAEGDALDVRRRLAEIQECLEWRETKNQGELVAQLNRDIRFLLSLRAAASSPAPAEPPPSAPIPHDTQRCPECRELICAWADCISHNQHKPHGPLQPEGEQEREFFMKAEATLRKQSLIAIQQLTKARQAAGHTEESGEVCTPDCEGCNDPVGQIVRDLRQAQRTTTPPETPVVAREPSEQANAAATEICDYCGIDTNDAEQVVAIITRHLPAQLAPAALSRASKLCRSTIPGARVELIFQNLKDAQAVHKWLCNAAATTSPETPVGGKAQGE